MANWQFTLDFKDFWQDDEIALFDKSQKVVEEINALLPEIRKRAETILHLRILGEESKAFSGTLKDMADELEDEVLPMFGALVEEQSEDVEDFDNALYYLYEWADSSLDNEWGGKKMCWVKTLF